VMRAPMPSSPSEPPVHSELSTTCRHAASSSRAVHLLFRAFEVATYRRIGYRSLPGLAPSRKRTFEVFRRVPSCRGGFPGFGRSPELGAAPEFYPDGLPVGWRALLGFCAPSAFTVAGSDIHRVCLARFCCAFRFSQPPGALLLPGPSGFVSRRSRSWGSPFRGFPFDEAGVPLGTACPS